MRWLKFKVILSPLCSLSVPSKPATQLICPQQLAVITVLICSFFICYKLPIFCPF